METIVKCEYCGTWGEGYICGQCGAPFDLHVRVEKQKYFINAKSMVNWGCGTHNHTFSTNSPHSHTVCAPMAFHSH